MPTLDIQMAKPVNLTSIVLGILSLVLGVAALLVSWIPLIGIVALPFLFVGLLLALMGFVAAMGDYCLAHKYKRQQIKYICLDHTHKQLK